MKGANPLVSFDRRLRKDGMLRLVGADEVGRGCLAGPVVAAAVVLAPAGRLQGVRDSKQLTALQRDRQARRIRRWAVAYAWSFVPPRVIDRINIRQASLLALRRAIHRAIARAEALRAAAATGNAPPWLALVDGDDPVPLLRVPQQVVIDGDAQSCSIAAASIVAKTVRDAFMRRLAAEHPGYGFERHKGYATDEHLCALERVGPCRWHRLSFAPVAQPSLFEL